METAFNLLSILLILFALLGLYDGFYLHIFKYKLFNNPSSKNEHLTHTIRGILFPAILYFLYFRQDCTISFYIGLSLVLIDMITLGVDAFLESDSRKFMGGLPKWEYIIHLFVNGFHFAAIAVYLVVRIRVGGEITIQTNFGNSEANKIFLLLVKNLIPGAILMAAIHVFVAFPKTAIFWNKRRSKITCC